MFTRPTLRPGESWEPDRHSRGWPIYWDQYPTGMAHETYGDDWLGWRESLPADSQMRLYGFRFDTADVAFPVGFDHDPLLDSVLLRREQD